MSRLTEKKFLDNFKAIKNISPNYVASKEELMYEKLGKLEDLEEEIGCPLEVLNYKEVNYIRDNEQSYGSVLGINIQHKTIMIGSAWSFMEKPLNQFGKTWWLKEGRSE